MNLFWAIDDDYHQRVINHIALFPDALKARPGIQVCVWGHEVDLHDAGHKGGNGSTTGRLIATACSTRPGQHAAPHACVGVDE